MTLQGLNITVAIYHREQNSDDEGGGSNQRRTATYTHVPARIGNRMSPFSLRVQGIENVNMYDCVIQSPSYEPLVIRIDDVVVPETGQYTGKEFVVLAVQDDTVFDEHNPYQNWHRALSLRRLEEARRVQ